MSDLRAGNHNPSARGPLRRHLLRGGAWVFLGKLVTGVAQVFIAVLLARLLSPEEFGAFQVLQRMVLFAAILGSFGMGWVVIRRIAEGMNSEATAQVGARVQSVFGVVALLSSSVAIAFAIFGQDLMSLLLDADVQGYAPVMMALVIAASFQQVVPETFRGLHDLRLASLFSGAATNLIMLSGFSVLWAFQVSMNALNALEVYLVAAVMVLMTSATMLRQQLVREFGRPHRFFSFAFLGEDLKTGWPLTLSNVLAFVTKQADVWVVAAMFGVNQAAFYGAASRLVFLVAAPVMVANGATRGVIADLWARGEKVRLERLLRTVALLTLLAGMLPGLCFIFWSDPIMDMLFGDAYRTGGAVLSILVLGRLVLLAAGPAGTLMNLSGHERQSLRYDAMGAVLFGLGALALGRFFGMEGVAVVAVMANAFRPVMCMWFARRELGVRSYVGIPLRVMGRH